MRCANLKKFFTLTPLIFVFQNGNAVQTTSYDKWELKDLRDVGAEILTADTRAIDSSSNAVTFFGKPSLSISCIDRDVLWVGVGWVEGESSPGSVDLELTIDGNRLVFQDALTGINKIGSTVTTMLATSKIPPERVVSLVNAMRPANYIEAKAIIYGIPYYAKFSLSGLTKASNPVMKFCRM